MSPNTQRACSDHDADAQRRDVALVLFARRREHRGKALGLGRANARLSKLLLEHALHTTRAAAAGRMALAVVTDEPLAEGALAPLHGRGDDDVMQLLQQGDDFESRLLDALRRVAARGYRRLVLVGSDTPSLASADLERAAVTDSARAVLGPCPDGGFYLLSIDSAHLDALAGLPWRRASLYRALRQRLVARGLAIETLTSRADLDSARDVQRAFALLDALSRHYLARSLVDAPAAHARSGRRSDLAPRSRCDGARAPPLA
ncbi:MAG: DUF2064 domain-containing protein [Myxococcales bacterium]|nr:DUF2064 domain-containing protein [Myxococcales bacterium]